MNMNDMNKFKPSDVWPTILPECGGMVQAILSYLASVQDKLLPEISAAREQIERETTLGPLLNPTAYLGGNRFDNAEQYQQILSALATLVYLLPKPPEAPVDTKGEEVTCAP